MEIKNKDLLYLICKILADVLIVAGVIYKYFHHGFSLEMTIGLMIVGALFIAYEIYRYYEARKAVDEKTDISNQDG